MKRTLFRVASMLIAATLLVSLIGCQPSTSGASKAPESNAQSQTASADSNEGKDIRIWLPPFGTEDTMDKAFWEEQVKGFAEKTGAKVELQIISWDNYPDKYLTGINANEGPDLGYLYADIFPDFISMGAVDSLEGLLNDTNKANYLYLDYGNIMGKQYGLPIIVGNPRVMYYNKALLKDAGVDFPSASNPPTWDQFVEMCKKVTKDTDNDGTIDHWGILQGWGDKTYAVMQTTFTPFLLQAGSQMYADDGRSPTFGGEEGAKTAQFLQDLIYKHKVMSPDCTGMTEADTTAQFTAGNVGFICASTSACSQFGDVDWGYIPALTEKRTMTMQVCDQLVLMSSARNKQLTFDMMLYMTSGDVMTQFHQKLSAYPPIGKDEEYHDNEAFKDMYENYSDELATEKPVANKYQIDEHLFKNMQLVMMNEMDPAEAVQEAQQYGKSVLDELYSK